MNKILDTIFNTRKYKKLTTTTTPLELTDRYLRIFQENKNSNKNKRKRSLVIVPGYSVDNPPRIGHHLYYINALKYDPILNPLGYHQILLFDIYSEKDGRCNFKHDIPQLAKELMICIDTAKDNWEFEENDEIDFLGASMGGLIVRQLIHEKMKKSNLLPTKNWGTLKISTILLIATPNFGCKIVDYLQNPLVQFILRLLYGKDNFSKSDQFNQISIGDIPLFGKFLSRILKKKSTINSFLTHLNSKVHTPGKIRWITLRGTKNQWFSKILYGLKKENDGVVEAKRVSLIGAENIIDKDLGSDIAWNHRDLYMANDVCNLLFGLLILNLQLNDYLRLLNESFIKKGYITQKLPSRDIFDEYRKPIKSHLS